MSETEEIAAIESLEKAWCDAWNAHDMEALTALLHPDVDFVTVGGTWLRGKKEFKEHHALYHATSFKHSTFTVNRTSVKFLRPDLALTHVRWRLEGDFNPDGTPRNPRTGIFTQILRKSGDGWLILASHNTNDIAGEMGPTKELLRSRRWD
ncbi:MAG: SgcJ/EcaC family oxidoreductase [Thaumarchaeota archaeon]|nr:SgcJ/EcaC family oxidoreductase [Nitrososphaerota archaeon]